MFLLGGVGAGERGARARHTAAAPALLLLPPPPPPAVNPAPRARENSRATRPRQFQRTRSDEEGEEELGGSHFVGVCLGACERLRGAECVGAWSGERERAAQEAEAGETACIGAIGVRDNVVVGAARASRGWRRRGSSTPRRVARTRDRGPAWRRVCGARERSQGRRLEHVVKARTQWRACEGKRLAGGALSP